MQLEIDWVRLGFGPVQLELYPQAKCSLSLNKGIGSHHNHLKVSTALMKRELREYGSLEWHLHWTPSLGGLAESTYKNSKDARTYSHARMQAYKLLSTEQHVMSYLLSQMKIKTLAGILRGAARSTLMRALPDLLFVRNPKHPIEYNLPFQPPILSF